MNTCLRPKYFFKNLDPLLIGITLLSIPLYCYITAEICFMLGKSIGTALFPLSVLASVLTVTIISSQKAKSLFSTVFAVGLLIPSVLIMTVLSDCSIDGMTYHQEIIIHLVNGWNPFQSFSVSASDPDIELLVDHYVKGLETMAAVVVKFTGLIESGKIINLLIVLGTGFTVFSFLKKLLISQSSKMILLLTCLAILNPVGTGQLTTYYNDFAGYYLILMTIVIFGYCPRKFNSLQCLSLIAIIILSVATKFTAFFYVGFSIFATIIWYILHSEFRLALKISLFSVIGILISVLIFSYHPYVTNFLSAGHPCYPLMGENTIDIMTGNTPPEFLNNNRFTNFFSSLFSFTFPDYQQRKGGFGVLMAPMLIFSIIILIIGFYKNLIPKIYAYVAGWALLACFIFEQSWWARYIPFLWIVPCLGAMAALKLSNFWKLIGKGIVIAGIFSGIVFGTVQVFYSLQHSVTLYYANKIIGNEALVDYSLQTAINDYGDMVYVSRGTFCVLRHLQEAGIKFTDADSLDAFDKSVYISLSFSADSPNKVSAFFDDSKYDEIKHAFTETIWAKIFRLHNFIPDTMRQ